MGSLEQAVYAILIAFVIGVILCPILIPVLHKMKFGQNVRDDGPQTHLQKQGTPTMGGIAFLIAFVVASFFFLKGNTDGIAVVLMTLCYGIIGFLDDYIKVVKKRSLGENYKVNIEGKSYSPQEISVPSRSFSKWKIRKSGSSFSSNEIS